jgi:hypothetical protein
MDEESKQMLKAFEKEIEQDDVVVEKEQEKEPDVDWKEKHDELMVKYTAVTEKKDEYQRLLDKQMGMMRYMCEGAEKIGMKFDEMHIVGGDNYDHVNASP